MAALDFPSSPSNGQQYVGPGGVTWVYDLPGTKWVAATLAGGVFAPLVSPALQGNPTSVTPSPGDADTSIATTAFVTNAVATSLHDVGRNYLHNSMFNIAQRGAGPWAAGGYMVDRWVQNVASDALSVNQIAVGDADRAQIGDEEMRYCLQHVVTGNAAAAANSRTSQYIENVRRLAGKTVIISFYAKATAALNLGISLDQYFGTGGSPSAQVNANGQAVTLTTAWARYTVTASFASISGMVVGTNNDDRMQVNFWFSSGSTNAARSGNIGVQSGTFYLWGVQLELGSTATPLEKLDPVTQLQQCQRFYQIGPILLYGNAGSLGTGSAYQMLFPVQMRGTPAVTPTYTTQTNCGSSGIVAGSNTTYGFAPYTVITAVGGFVLSGTFTASADL